VSLFYEAADKRETPIGSPVSIIIWAFTTDASGNASEETYKVSGILKRVVTIPDAVAKPTAGWDLTIEEEDGFDILLGAGADRDSGGAGVSEEIIPSDPPAFCSILTFKVENAGSGKGVVKLYIV
jgi:hypothetical protein